MNAFKINRWIRLSVAVLIMLFTGIIYSWSILKAPFAADFGWNKAALGLNFTITMCFFCIGGIVGGVLVKKLLHRVIVLLCSLLLLTAFFIISRMSGKTILTLYIGYGAICGLGIGAVYNVVISAIASWFPDKRATASGAMMMGFGASSLILGSLTGYLLTAIGWRQTYFLLGVSISFVLMVGSFFISHVSEVPDGLAELAAATAGSASKKQVANTEVKNYTAAEMIKTGQFWKLYILSVLLSVVGTSVISMAKDTAIQVGAPEALAVSLVGVLSICNGISRPLSGWIFDRFGRTTALLYSLSLVIVASLVLLFAVLSHSVVIVVLGMALVGLAYGTTPPINSGFMSSLYGPKNFALNFSVLNTLLIPASFGATITGIIINTTGSYSTVFITLLGFAVAAFIIGLSFIKDIKRLTPQ